MTRIAVLPIVLGLAVAHLAGQTPDFPFQRFGSVPVSDAEVTQIEELAGSTGKRLWLLRTPNPVMTGERTSFLYLEPDVIGTRVLRGRVLRLFADEAPWLPIKSPWRIRDSVSYAYIPRPGRQPGVLAGEQDLDWPFHLRGEFDDDTLVSLVAFIRTQPPIPMPAFRKTVPDVPIAGIGRQEDAIVVGLRPREDMNDAVWLVRKNGRWVITRSETSVN